MVCHWLSRINYNDDLLNHVNYYIVKCLNVQIINTCETSEIVKPLDVILGVDMDVVFRIIQMYFVYSESQQSTTDASTRSPNPRSRIPNSIGGEIPEKYYVVRNNDVMRVKFLLIYVRKSNLQR